MKNNIADRSFDFVQKLPDYLTFLGIGALLIEEFVRGTLGHSFLKSDTSDLRITLGIAVISMMAISLTTKLKDLKEQLGLFTGKYLGVLEVLKSYERMDFKELLEKSSEVRLLTLAGTKTGHLGDTGVQESLADKDRKSTITILLANPFSEAIITRYKNDEPDTYESGIEGIKRRLLWLHKTYNDLPLQSRDKLDIRVFDNYPTISIIQADDHIYSSVYGYKLRGGDCPKVHAKIDGDYGKFIIKHFNKVYDNATELNNWFSLHNLGSENKIMA